MNFVVAICLGASFADVLPDGVSCLGASFADVRLEGVSCLAASSATFVPGESLTVCGAFDEFRRVGSSYGWTDPTTTDAGNTVLMFFGCSRSCTWARSHGV